MRSDLDGALADRSADRIDDPELQDSAVVLSIRERSEPEIAFIRRTAYRDEHAGEIGLPGGRADADDEFPAGTALREYEEEVGVAPEHVDVLGRLDEVATPTGYRIVPLVGYVDSDAEFEPCETEVDELLFVPLSVLREQHEPGEEPEFEYEDARIWGATGRILSTFLTAIDR